MTLNKILIIFHLIALELSDCSNTTLLGEFLTFNLNQHYTPITLRPIIFHNRNISSNSEDFNWEVLTSSTAPILLIDKLLGKDRNRFFTSTVLYSVVDIASLQFTLSHLKIESANRRWDRVVLIGTEEYIKDKGLQQVLQNYRSKMVYALDTNRAWTAPKSYYSGEDLQEVDLNTYKSPSRFANNLEGRHFRIAGCEFPPWTMKIRDGKGGERVAGTHYQIVAFSAKTLNFTFETNVLDGPNYGELHPNGTWTGMYAMIYYRELNYDWCFMLGHDASWSSWVDYASTFGTIDLVFATGWPKAELKWTAVFEPLQQTVWLCTLLSFLMMSCFIYIFMKIQFFHIADLKFSKKYSVSITDCLMTPYAILLEQGVEVREGIRFLIALWLMFTIIFGTGYKSTLKSRLTFPSPEKVPSNYKELAGRADFNIILNAQGVVEKSFFATTIVPEMVNIRSRMKNDPSTESCVVAAFLQQHFACIGWYPYFKQTASATLTLFSSLEPLIYTKQAAHFNSLSMAFQKDSIFVDGFTPVTAALYETGVYSTWEEEVNNYFKDIGRQKVLLENENGEKNEIYDTLVELSKLGENVTKPLKIGNVYVVFILAGFGCGFGLIVLGFEKVLWKQFTGSSVEVTSSKKQLLPQNAIAPNDYRITPVELK